MKNKNILSISLGVVAVLILGIVIAYAALSTTLNARFNSVTAGDISWDVGFNTRYPTLTGVSSNGAVCGDAHITREKVTFDQINLPNNNSSCTYTITVSNNGNLDAEVSNITPLEPDTFTCTTSTTYGIPDRMTCGDIEYSVSNPEGVAFQNSIISAGGAIYAEIEVSYVGSAPTSPVTQEGAGFNFNFTQA